VLLDREPAENEISDALSTCKNIKQLRESVLRCAEFAIKNPDMGTPVMLGQTPPMRIDDVQDSRDLQVLFAHIQASWEQFGETEPHWSVLTNEQFKNAKIDQNMESFYETGKHDYDQKILGTFVRNNVDIGKIKSCLEYGCGVGRVTRWLADAIDKVFAYDISLPHITLAKQYMNSKNVHNIFFEHLKYSDDIYNLPKVDFIFSVIVLQHNPPPVIEIIIRQFMKSLNKGGYALFQVPTYRKGYVFDIKEYLKYNVSKNDMEMHVLPQRKIFKIL
jgi:SAM-dependent methyltransferase